MPGKHTSSTHQAVHDAGGAHETDTALASRAGNGTLATCTKLADKYWIVCIGGVPDAITTSFCLAGDIAKVFGIDTSVIADFDKNAIIGKVVQGPIDVQGKWDLCTVMMDFAPGKYGLKKHATSC